MSPFLEKETDPEAANFKRYITEGGRIYCADATTPLETAFETHSVLANKIGVVKVFDTGLEKRPIVDDGGYIYVEGGRFKFGDSTTSCHVRDKTTAKSITYKVAVSILGKDKVCRDF